MRVTGLDREDSQDMEMEKELIPFEFQDAMEHRHAFSQFSEDSDFAQSEAELNELSAIAEQIEEYSYSVRIFPGQDPAYVWVGWVTPSFHFMEKTFEMKKVRHVVISQLDMDYKLKSRWVDLAELRITGLMLWSKAACVLVCVCWVVKLITVSVLYVSCC